MPVVFAPDHVEKRLSLRERAEPEAALRFRSEAAILTRLSTLRVTPRLLASGEDAAGPWLRIERIPMPMLASRLLGQPLDLAWVDRAIRSAFAALAEIHEAEDRGGPLRVIHADLSPANVAIDDTATRAMILDFDLACWREGPPRDGAFRGTILYTAPEIARGDLPTVQSDLFSLAATLWHAASGAPPRVGSSLAALLATAGEKPVFTEGAPVPRSSGEAALIPCLAHDPRDRPASARDVVLACGGRTDRA
jgi:eukaryotic-like serine/threonine-protein kinase